MREAAALILLLGLAPAFRVETDPSASLPLLPPGVGAALAQPGVVVTRDGRPWMRLWLAARIPAAPPFPPDTPPIARGRINYAFLPGALVGVLELLAPWTDARGQPIAAGVYALRYVVQPLMKEHSGVSEFRDTLVLVLPEDSEEEAPDDLAVLASASQRVSGTGHPAVIALYPSDPDDPTPRIHERADLRLLQVRGGDNALALLVAEKNRAPH